MHRFRSFLSFKLRLRKGFSHWFRPLLRRSQALLFPGLLLRKLLLRSKQLFNGNRLSYRRRTLSWILILLCVIGGYNGIIYLSQKLNLYSLELVKINGVSNLHPYEILEELALEQGRSLLAINAIALEQKLLKKPQIAKVYIEKQFPNTLNIIIVEKPIAFLVKTPIELYAISSTGEVLFRGNEIDNHNYFTIELNMPLHDEIPTTPPLNAAFHAKVAAFLKAFHRLSPAEQNIQHQFSGIYFGPEIFLFAANTNVTVKLGTELSLKQLRKTHYAYLYKNQHRISASIIDLRTQFIRYTH